MEPAKTSNPNSAISSLLRRNLEELKRLGNRRYQTLLAAAGKGSTPELDVDEARKELKKTGPALLTHLIELRHNHRLFHRNIETKGSQVMQVRDQLETISNYHEGIIYQKSNIEREIFNCRKGTQLPNLEKLTVPQVVEPLADLGKRKTASQTELQTLDSVLCCLLRKLPHSWLQS